MYFTTCLLVMGALSLGQEVLGDAANKVEIDVLYLYTPEAADDWTSGDIFSALDDAHRLSNEALKNSEIDLVFNAIYGGELPSGLEDFTDKLKAVRTNDDTQDLRNTYGADLVQVVVSGWAATGYGFQNGQEVYGYSIVGVTNLKAQLFLESTSGLGHNLGCHRNRAALADPGESDDEDSYNHGWLYCPKDDDEVAVSFRTIKTLNCSPGSDTERVPYFSNPDVDYEGLPTGTSKNNNARTIRDNMETVSNYRETRCSNDLDGVPTCYLGCFNDKRDSRIMSDKRIDDELTIESCASECEGHNFFGLQNGDECWCGDEGTVHDLHGTADGRCSYECAGDTAQTCGGSFAMTVYEYQE